MILFFLLLIQGGILLGAARGGGSSFPTAKVVEECKEESETTSVWRDNPLYAATRRESMLTCSTRSLPVDEEEERGRANSDVSVEKDDSVFGLVLHPQRSTDEVCQRVLVVEEGKFIDPKEFLQRKMRLDIEGAIITQRANGIVPGKPDSEYVLIPSIDPDRKGFAVPACMQNKIKKVFDFEKFPVGFADFMHAGVGCWEVAKDKKEEFLKKILDNIFDWHVLQAYKKEQNPDGSLRYATPNDYLDAMYTTHPLIHLDITMCKQLAVVAGLSSGLERLVDTFCSEICATKETKSNILSLVIEL